MQKIKDFLFEKTPITNWAIIGLLLIVFYHSVKLVF